MAGSNVITAVVLCSAATIGAMAARAQTISPAFAGAYTARDLGSIDGVPKAYGGLTLMPGDPDTLLIGGDANLPEGALYRVGVVRGAGNHIVGFAGPATRWADAPYNDGGVRFGPGGVLFFAQWPVNKLGQIRPGSSVVDKTIDLGPLGVEVSASSLSFVPAGFPGAGKMKLQTYHFDPGTGETTGGQWNDLTLTADGAGTYDVTSVTEVPGSRLYPGPEAFEYVPIGSPLTAGPMMISADFDGGTIELLQMDGDGNPLAGTQQQFMFWPNISTRVDAPEGLFFDPVTGDLLISTFGDGINEHVMAVSGFVPSPGTLGALGLAGLAVGAGRRRG